MSDRKSVGGVGDERYPDVNIDEMVRSIEEGVEAQTILSAFHEKRARVAAEVMDATESGPGERILIINQYLSDALSPAVLRGGDGDAILKCDPIYKHDVESYAVMRLLLDASILIGRCSIEMDSTIDWKSIVDIDVRAAREGLMMNICYVGPKRTKRSGANLYEKLCNIARNRVMASRQDRHISSLPIAGTVARNAIHYSKHKGLEQWLGTLS